MYIAWLLNYNKQYNRIQIHKAEVNKARDSENLFFRNSYHDFTVSLKNYN